MVAAAVVVGAAVVVAAAVVVTAAVVVAAAVVVTAACVVIAAVVVDAAVVVTAAVVVPTAVVVADGVVVTTPVVVAPAVVVAATVVAAAVVSSCGHELLAGTGTLGSLQLHSMSVRMLRYALVVHRAWLCLVRVMMPRSLPYSLLPQAMVTEVILLQVTVCWFPVEFTMVEHVRVLSSGHLQTTFVSEPSTDEAAAVVLSDPGRQIPVVFFLIVVISLTPATGWQQKVRKRSEDMRRPLPYISHARSHLGRCRHRWQPSVLAAGEQLCLFLGSSETGGEALLPGKGKVVQQCYLYLIF